MKSLSSKQPVARVGINFGAPGDRQAKSGTTWLDYPSVGGPSPNVKLRAVSKSGDYFRLHSTQVNGGGLKWVAASGLEGVTSLTLQVNGKPTAKKYSLKLYFLEPDMQTKPGSRVFDVKIPGATTISGLDVVKESGGVRRLLVKEVPGVTIGKSLTITFDPKRGRPLICGVEVVRQ